MQIDALRMHCQGWGVYGQMPAPLGGSSTGTHKGKFIGWLRGGGRNFWPFANTTQLDHKMPTHVGMTKCLKTLVIQPQTCLTDKVSQTYIYIRLYTRHI